MNLISQIETLESEIKIKEQYLLPLRELSANLREQLRRREEAFAYTSRQEPVPEYTIKDNNSGVVLKLPVDVLLKYVDKEIDKTLNPLEESIAKLNKIKEILGE